MDELLDCASIISGIKQSDILQNEILKDASKKVSKLSKKEKLVLLKSAVEMMMISIKDSNHDLSIGVARFIFLSGLDTPLKTIKELGAFRPSKYGYKTSLLKLVIKDLCKITTFIDEDKKYINNVLALVKFSPEVLCLKTKIQAFIKSRPHFLKNSLAIAETEFIDMGLRNSNRADNVEDHLYSLSRETFLSSISYTLQLYKEVKNEILSSDSIYVESTSMDKAYLNIFRDAYLIQIFKESEINVDFFHYDATLIDNNNLIIENREFEYYVRSGYAKSELRWSSLFSQFYNNEEVKDFPKLEIIMDDLFNNEVAERFLYEIKEEPIERIVAKALFLNYEENKDLFCTDTLFFEEILMLWTLSNENYTSDFANINLYKEFTALDILKIQRFFSYISHVYKKAYENISKIDATKAKVLRKRSLLPVMKTEDLADALHRITGHSIEDCTSFIHRISVNFDDPKSVIDLQYSAIVKMGNASLILPTIFSSSNLIRAFALNEKVHLSIIEKKDAMVNSIKNQLLKSGFSVVNDLQYGKVEIDILAYLDGHLFVFECKNPYHPVNPFELRNTYNQIIKGFDQIKKIKDILKDKQSLRQLLHKAKFEHESIKEVHYGVINANRVLCGLTEDNISVFHANELINFIKAGEVVMDDGIYRTWKGEYFTVNDLIRYINRDVLVNDFREISKDVYYEYKFRAFKLTLMSNFFEVHKLPSLFKGKYLSLNKNQSAPGFL
ncbi:hypothetical protein [Pantoea sp. GM_Pan_4]|uniref:hypothetical protein n=1 Tax=Pantoea sp. GM_Pan_4 TaxID=2937389 RepID=UPI002269F9D5|nr:hypothetical protein [Pantoea sp. GM_Pan_4]